jgi:hypothetical protein
VLPSALSPLYLVIRKIAAKAEVHVVDQAWFWTEDWQDGEREANAAIAAGRTTFHESTEDFLAALDSRRRSRADA